MIVEAEDLAFTYAGQESPAGIPASLKLAAGHVRAITGPNGSGKTTLHRVLSGLAPTVFRGRLSGRGAVLGLPLPLPEGPPSSAGIMTDSAITQLTGLRSTVAGEIVVSLENRGWSRDQIRERTAQLLASLDLEPIAQRSPVTLSGGELQRVLIAAAIAHQPRLIIMDDPTLHLDPDAQIDLRSILTQEVEGGAAVLFTSSSDDEARRLGADETTQLGRGEQAKEALNEGSVLAPRGSEPVLLAMRDVSYAYTHGPRAAKGVNMCIQRGEVVGLVGPNGSGKTTLARLALGLLQPDSGRIEVRGRDRRDRHASDVARDIGLVFQNPADQLFKRSALMEASFGPRLRGAGRQEAERLAEAALLATGLFEVGDANPRDLGWSERRLLCLASMLAAQPPLLILDEPTAGLDPRQSAVVSRIMRLWARRGGGVLAVTHDRSWATTSCDSLVRMERGVLGVPERVGQNALTDMVPPAENHSGSPPHDN